MSTLHLQIETNMIRMNIALNGSLGYPHGGHACVRYLRACVNEGKRKDGVHVAPILCILVHPPPLQQSSYLSFISPDKVSLASYNALIRRGERRGCRTASQDTRPSPSSSCFRERRCVEKRICARGRTSGTNAWVSREITLTRRWS